MVERIVEYIYAGDAFQVVPSQRWSAPVPVEAFSIYRGLRAVNPSPYMYFLDFGDFQVAGASPEPLLTVSGRHVTHASRSPARARAARTPRRTAASPRELLADEKERAEHVMLVDLGRNDLGRVCEYGSVDGRRADGDRVLQPRHAHRLLGLGHAARGRRRDGRAALGAARRARSRARRRCARCRSSTSSSRSSAAATAARSATSATRGDLDTAIHIRTVVVKDGVAHVQAGGGTVADAKPDVRVRGVGREVARRRCARSSSPASSRSWP